MIPLYRERLVVSLKVKQLIKTLSYRLDCSFNILIIVYKYNDLGLSTRITKIYEIFETMLFNWENLKTHKPSSLGKSADCSITRWTLKHLECNDILVSYMNSSNTKICFGWGGGCMVGVQHSTQTIQIKATRIYFKFFITLIVFHKNFSFEIPSQFIPFLQMFKTYT
jgi:hypothetical protein